MIVGIGCDIVEHETVKILEWTKQATTLSKIFSKKELELYYSKEDEKFLIGRFAAKEAIVKCLGTGMQDGIALTDIQILHSNSGQPTISLLGKVKKISTDMKINFWHITITHSDKFTMAFVIAECF